LKPDEEGLKEALETMAGRHHPEEQGLKHNEVNLKAAQWSAGRHHPEEQGLKLQEYDPPAFTVHCR